MRYAQFVTTSKLLQIASPFISKADGYTPVQLIYHSARKFIVYLESGEILGDKK